MIARPWHGAAWFSERVFAYLGAIDATDLHAHHAIQVAIAIAQPIELRDETAAVATCDAFVIPADTRHAIARASERALLVFVDPDDEIGAALASRVRAAGVAAWHDAGAAFAALPRSLPLRELVARVVEIAGVVPRELHPAIREALRLLPELVGDESAVRVAALAKRVALSESRLMHLFREQVGIPLRPYMRWLRLRRAASLVRAGATLTEAAHAAAFADSAHLSSTFHRTFGLSPSDVMRNVEWIE